MSGYQGQCFCGAIEIEVSGEPISMAYCHCESCRSWSGSPVHASTMWASDSVEVVAGSKHLTTFLKTPDTLSHRIYCGKCGGHLMISHPSLGLYDVFAATLPGIDFKPTLHVHYAETVLPIKDGLPKYKDFPKEFGGGTGELMDE